MKRLFLFLVFVVLFGGYAMAYDFVAVCESGQTLFYNITSSEEPYTTEVASIYYSSATGSLTIPSSVTYSGRTYFVTGIGSQAFYDCSRLTEVTIPNSVASIGEDAFGECSGLTRVNYSGSLAQWCGITFSPNFFSDESNPLYYAHYLYINNSLVTNLVIPNTITEIKAYSFSGATCLTSVTIPNSVTSIGNSAFSGCSGLTEITIPELVTSIGDGAFSSCSGLTVVNFNATNCTTTGNSSSRVFYGCTSPATLNIGDNVRTIPANAFEEFVGLTSVTIGSGVTSIGQGAFYNCSGLTRVDYTGTIAQWCGITFGNYAAQPLCNAHDLYINSSLVADLVIPNTVTEIKAFAFCGASCLTSVTIGNSVTSIGSGAFSSCSGLISITIPVSVSSIQDNAFGWCSGLTEVTIPNSVTSIGVCSFENCSGLTSVTIPNSVTSIGWDAFYNVRNIVYNGTATGSPWGALTVNGYVDGYLIYSDDTRTHLTGCSSLATDVTIPNSVTSIGSWAFYQCNRLTYITIPNSVMSIGSSAFSECSGLTSVTIGNSVTSIGAHAFDGCSGLTSLTIGNSVESIGSGAFYNCGMTSVTIPNSVTSIGGGAFYGCSGLTSVTIGNSVTSIGDYAFVDCSGLTSVTIPNSVTSIGDAAFWGCSGLTIVNFNATNCTSMGNSNHPVFNGCTSLVTLNIGENVTNIPAYAFCYCSGLSSITIPNSVTSIGNGAFSGCNGLTTFNFNATNCTTVGNSVFYDCSSLSVLNIGENVTRIPANAFSGCDSLTTVNYNATNCTNFSNNNGLTGNANIRTIIVGGNVRSLPAGIFSGCSGLEAMTIPFVGGSATATTASPSTLFGYIFGTESYAGGTSILQWYGDSVTYYIPASLRSVTFTGSNMFHGAFSRCSMLTEISIPESMSSISDDVFYECSGLTSITIPVSVSSIGNYAFCDCSNLASVYYAGSIEQWCRIAQGDFSFRSTGHNLYVNNSLITDLTIPNTITEIKNYAFSSVASLTSVTIPNSVTSIGNGAFFGCSGLSSVIIPNSVASIGEWSFFYCNGLTEVVIGNSVESIGEFAFWDCRGLTDIYANPTTPPTVGNYTFFYDSANYYPYDDATIWVQCGSVSAYMAADIWGNFSDIRENFPYTLSVSSADLTKGTASITQHPDCTDGIGIITATANNSYAFLAWNDGNTDNPRTIELVSDTTFTATFDVARTVTVEVSDSEMGTVTGSGIYAEGAVIEITAVPNEGYRFDHWIDVENPTRDFNTDNPRTIVVSSDVSYIAVFEVITGIEESAVSEIALFPNPVTDILNITSSETISEIEIVNVMGQVVYRREVNANNTVCDVEGLVKGVYIVRIHGPEMASVICQRKFIKE